MSKATLQPSHVSPLPCGQFGWHQETYHLAADSWISLFLKEIPTIFKGNAIKKLDPTGPKWH